MKNIAILTIDMQPGFLNNLEPEKRKALIENHQELYSICQEKGIEIINIEYDTKGDTISELTQGRQEQYKANNFSKKAWSAFTNKKLNEYVEKRGFQGFILTGLHAERCIFTTGRHKENEFVFYNCGELTEFRNLAKEGERKKYINWASNEKNNNFYYPELEELLEDLKNDSLPLN